MQSISLNDLIYNRTIEIISQKIANKLLFVLQLYSFLILLGVIGIWIIIILKNKGKIFYSDFFFILEEIIMPMLVVSSFILIEIVLFISGVRLYA